VANCLLLNVIKKGSPKDSPAKYLFDIFL